MEFTNYTAGHLSTAEHETLAGLVARARERSRALDRPLLLGYGFDLGGVDLLSLLERLGVQNDFRFYWENPAEGFALTAGGVARDFSAGGPTRFSRLSRDIEQTMQDALCESEGREADGGMVVLGGFSFFDQLEQKDWPGFEPARLVAPAWIVRRDARGTSAMVSTEITPRCDTEKVLLRLGMLMAGLRRTALDMGRMAGNTFSQSNNFTILDRKDGKDGWLEVVARARDYIRKGSLAKIVLARALDLNCEIAPSPFVMLRRLREKFPHCYNFYFDPGAGQGFIGASPEQLARFDGMTVSTAALAGTMPRGGTPSEDEANGRALMASRKERAEHQFVLEGMVSALSPFGQVGHPHEPRLLKLNNLQHLYTPLTLRLDNRLPVLELLERLHPTPAVGGHPTEAALALIPGLESFDRGWYAGPLGWFNSGGQGEFAVSLRSGVLRGMQVRLFAGGGIMADSSPEKEFEETLLKFRPLLGALGN
ncbi:MAG: isochorismate synthase [Deltaproteobacteria bacterium]|nr:isochorismate synthase [Deltaproteobacteria bacterium]